MCRQGRPVYGLLGIPVALGYKEFGDAASEFSTLREATDPVRM